MAGRTGERGQLGEGFVRRLLAYYDHGPWRDRERGPREEERECGWEFIAEFVCLANIELYRA